MAFVQNLCNDYTESHQTCQKSRTCIIVYPRFTVQTVRIDLINTFIAFRPIILLLLLFSAHFDD